MRMRSPPDALNALNRQARERAYGVDDLDWARAADRTKPWAPEGVGALWFAPSFAALDDAQRLRCNQLHALSLAEKLIWFEQHVIRAAGNVLRTEQPPAPLEEALQHFVQEEGKHVEMFRRLLLRSEPEWYGRRGTKLFGVSPLQQFGMNLAADHPGSMLAWAWLLIFVEERTLYLARLYLEAARREPGRIDPLHTEVHEFHFRDEVRHYHLDRHLLTWLYDPQPRWKKRLCALVFRRMVRSYISAGSAAPRILAQLGREFPGLQATLIPRMRVELAQVDRNPHYHQKLFGRTAMPHTLALIAEYPEHDGLWDVLIGETKQGILEWAR